MYVHLKIVILGIELGYIKSEAGICHGFAVFWLEAYLSHSSARFDATLRTIKETESSRIIELIETAKTKVRNRESITEDTQAGLDLLEFFENIVLYQSPEDFPELFNQSIYQHEVSKVSQFLASLETKPDSGVIELERWIGLYRSKDELALYLTDLHEKLTSITTCDDQPIGFKLGSQNHTIVLIYENGTWIGMDINQSLRKFSDINSLAIYLKNGFLGQSVITSSILTFGVHKRQEALIDAMKGIRESCLAGLTRNLSEMDPCFAVLLVREGYMDLIPMFANLGLDFKRARIEGLSPVLMAVLMGRVDALQLLSEMPGITFNEPLIKTKNIIELFLCSKSPEIQARMGCFMRLQLGEQASEKTHIQLSAKDIAQIMGHEDILDMLTVIDRRAQHTQAIVKALQAIVDKGSEKNSLSSLPFFKGQSFKQQFAAQLLKRLTHEGKIEPCLLQHAFSPASIREVIMLISTKGSQAFPHLKTIIPKTMLNLIEKVRAGIDSDFDDSERFFPSISIQDH